MTEAFPNEVHMSLMDHLKELHKRFVSSLIVWSVLTVLGFIFGEYIYFWLMSAIPKDIPQTNLHLFAPVMMRLKLAIYTGIFFSLPYWSYQAYAFIRPALRIEEGGFAKSFIFFAWILLAISFVFTHYMLGYFVDSLLSWTPEGVEQMASIETYISDFLAIYIGFCLLFQVPLVIYLSIQQGFVEAKFYRQNRRWVIVILLTLCAIFTPPDPLSQLAVFIPIYALFELSVTMGGWFSRKAKT